MPTNKKITLLPNNFFYYLPLCLEDGDILACFWPVKCFMRCMWEDLDLTIDTGIGKDEDRH